MFTIFDFHQLSIENEDILPAFFITFFMVHESISQIKENVDLILINAKIYALDEAFSQAEALVISNGKFFGIVHPKRSFQNTVQKKLWMQEGTRFIPDLSMLIAIFMVCIGIATGGSHRHQIFPGDTGTAEKESC